MLFLVASSGTIATIALSMYFRVYVGPKLYRFPGNLALAGIVLFQIMRKV
jgi:hypothetical protein